LNHFALLAHPLVKGILIRKARNLGILKIVLMDRDTLAFFKSCRTLSGADGNFA